MEPIITDDWHDDMKSILFRMGKRSTITIKIEPRYRNDDPAKTSLTTTKSVGI